MSWITPPLPPVASEPLPLTVAVCAAIEETIAELNAIIPLPLGAQGPAPRILVAEIDGR